MKGDYLMELFCQWCIMLLGIFGLVQLSELIFIWMRRPQQKPPVFSVLPLSGKVKNPEQTLTYFQEVALWSPESQLAFVLDCGMEEESKKICRSWCENKSRLIFCTQKEFEEICKPPKDKVY